MSPEKQNAPGAEPGNGEKPVFVGEEAAGARTSPAKDILAAIVIGLLALVAMSFALTLQVTENVLTAPGLLPFLTAITLLAMAIGLGVKAVRAGGAISDAYNVLGTAWRSFADTDTRRTAVLVAVVVSYVVAVDVVAFELILPTPGFVFAFSSYELISGIALTVLLKFFWGATITRCLLVAFVWVIILATIFRYGFHILLPGLA